jgi:hypothetical protein
VAQPDLVEAVSAFLKLGARDQHAVLDKLDARTRARIEAIRKSLRMPAPKNAALPCSPAFAAELAALMKSERLAPIAQETLAELMAGQFERAR